MNCSKIILDRYLGTHHPAPRSADYVGKRKVMYNMV